MRHPIFVENLLTSQHLFGNLFGLLSKKARPPTLVLVGACYVICGLACFLCRFAVVAMFLCALYCSALVLALLFCFDFGVVALL